MRIYKNFSPFFRYADGWQNGYDYEAEAAAARERARQACIASATADYREAQDKFNKAVHDISNYKAKKAEFEAAQASANNAVADLSRLYAATSAANSGTGYVSGRGSLSKNAACIDNYSKELGNLIKNCDQELGKLERNKDRYKQQMNDAVSRKNNC